MSGIRNVYFRFGIALVFAVAVSVTGVAIEKAALNYRREISRQQYQLSELQERHEKMRLRTQKLGAPSRMVESMRKGRMSLQRPKQPAPITRRKSGRPLLRWQSLQP